MAQTMNRKKFHHFLHDGYLKAWRMPTTIYVYDLRERKSFDKTGRDVGGEGKFNVFSFDQTVGDLLRYTFAERAHRDESGGVYRLMLGFIDFMKDFDYQHKSDNLLEDFYGEFETRIGKALKLVEDGKQLILNETQEAFDSLVFFFCLQLFRTPKIRRLLSDEMVSVYYANEQLEAQQKAEYIKMHLFISGLAMAVDILGKGCRIRLRYARHAGKFVNSDAPAVLRSGVLRRLEEMEGWMPLSPHVLMEIECIGLGFKWECRGDISGIEVENFNRRLIRNAERWVYFSSRSQRARHLDCIPALRK
ncbi:DUF4238 domain-containing protein [Paraburkholderia sabiae]|uniref:DUF4238 domain-containing protein n=1 Tax=Paraburkholderia sabiae TaxID=273251 RepID=A0ABU9QH19_9BURK|nr:DUF4238 domain-containing protein [Paraburkholderia sabiae]WJZ75519.1 DUF4238 domain-containing protein [Paraburkholderia sabiae]CAD6557169.1 hypothetical protein LMG24235_06052 [Paraburkholderia sabiae]